MARGKKSFVFMARGKENVWPPMIYTTGFVFISICMPGGQLLFFCNKLVQYVVL
jgi:hypothetical protein